MRKVIWDWFETEERRRPRVGLHGVSWAMYPLGYQRPPIWRDGTQTHHDTVALLHTRQTSRRSFKGGIFEPEA